MKEQAEKLAANGYIALAVDIYEGKVAVDLSEARKLEARKPKRRLRLTDIILARGGGPP